MPSKGKENSVSVEKLDKTKLDDLKELKKLITELNSHWEKNNKTLDKVKKEVQGLELDRINYNINKMESSICEMAENVEVIQGKLKTFEDLRSSKEGITKESKQKVKVKEVAYESYEDEVLTNISMFGHKIIDELTKASKVYSNSKALEDSITKERNEYKKNIEVAREESKKESIEEGKKYIIKELASKFRDLDYIFDSNESTEEILVALLKNYGLEKDNEIYKGNNIEITKANRVTMEAKCSFNNLGKYKVIKSTFLLDSTLFQKGQLEKIDD